MFNPDMSEIVKVIDQSKSNGLVVEVIEYQEVEGLYDKSTRGFIHKLRQVRIYLNNGGELVTEAGALQFMKGNVTMSVNSSVKSSAKGFFSGALTGESSVKPRYTGIGEVYLEPSTKHYLILEMQNEQIIADKGIFYCCEGSVEVGVFKQKSFSAAIAGGEGLFQTKLTGSGIVVVESTVPFEQILVYHLENETLQVDGNYALLRRGNIEFTVEKSTKSLIGSARSGEGFLQTFRGTGEVWLVPTFKNISAAF